MSQSKKNSLIESISNTFIGMIVTFAVSPVIYWACSMEVSATKMGMVTILFTLVSIIRNYFIRRWFSRTKQVDGQPLHRLAFKLVTLKNQKPLAVKISCLELYDTYLSYRLDFEAEEFIDPEDHGLGTNVVSNDFFVKGLRKQVVGCERLLTDDGYWKICIVVDGFSNDLVVYFGKKNGQESLEFFEVVNNWIINK